ncbi:AraC family transcriptional regulator [Amycolatopsis acidicola]|uniref:AraC family transcriptional regulator n=2 Tax=Amycolatopsis acidicola TaxID=2596893 RepID=A0A5N0V0Q1_9PSEU|nr:AraC family transcriptional regulator [Amycolatopsis acidicola]
MHAHFEQHVYHRHSHETYSFGVTETGAQAFTCRGEGRTSAAGMVMALNPDDPHDGQSAVAAGFTYRMIHIGPELITDQLGDASERPAGLPLFTQPVLEDPVLANALRTLDTALQGESRLAQDEALAATVRALVRRGSTRPLRTRELPGEVSRAREILEASFAEDMRAEDLAAAAGCSRFALHRGFVAAYGMAPSDYQRQLRLRAARRLLADGHTPAQAAAAAGFADQSHLTRWFKRYYGVTPGRFQRP